MSYKFSQKKLDKKNYISYNCQRFLEALPDYVYFIVSYSGRPSKILYANLM